MDAVCGIIVSEKGVRDYLVCALPLVGGKRCTVGTLPSVKQGQGWIFRYFLVEQMDKPSLIGDILFYLCVLKAHLLSPPIHCFSHQYEGRGCDGTFSKFGVWKLLFVVHKGYDWMEELSKHFKHGDTGVEPDTLIL